MNLKISIITAVFNRVDTIADALRSVQSQTCGGIEHIVVDGGSTDGTVEILQTYSGATTSCGYQLHWSSEPDFGIYDALNKGLARATGEVIGLMHSDDFFANIEVLADVAAVFNDTSVDAVYGDLDYVTRRNPQQIVRRWRSSSYVAAKLSQGWMPPHPTLFLRRAVIQRLGGFDTSYKIAADYDAILRYFGRGKIRSVHIPKVLVKMRWGGESNRTLACIWLKTKEDLRALRSNNVGGIGSLIWKNLSKIRQFV